MYNQQLIQRDCCLGLTAIIDGICLVGLGLAFHSKLNHEDYKPNN